MIVAAKMKYFLIKALCEPYTTAIMERTLKIERSQFEK